MLNNFSNRGRDMVIGMEKTILSFENVTGKKRGFILKNINFELKAGYVCGLIGKNGAGKTTLMNYILKENSKYDGIIRIDGVNIRDDHTHVLNKIGFVSEDNCFFENCTCNQNTEILSVFYDDFNKEKYRDIMDYMNLSGKKVYKKMSRGERLKFQLAFAIAHSPRIYLLDEVTAGMDPVFRIDFFHILQQVIIDESASVLMTSHISSEAELKTDYIGVMENGILIDFGESPDVMSNLKMKKGADYETKSGNYTR